MRCLLLILTFLGTQINAQLNFEFVWGNEKIENFKNYPFLNNDSISFSELKLYVSDYLLKSDDRYLSVNSVDLIDNGIPSSKIILDSINLSSYETLSFNFGMDSTINTSGILTGDLDPMKGMYWAWNSGYINLKMVGKSSLVNTLKNEFEYHLGGYRKPNGTCFRVSLPLTTNSIQLDLKSLFLNPIDLKNNPVIMIPGKTASQITESASNLFSIE